MQKPVIWLLILVGLLFFFIGALLSKFLLYLGLISVFIGLYLGLKPDGILRREQVFDSWAVLIHKAKGKAEFIFENTQANIKENDCPELEMKRQSMSPGFLKGVLGTTRDFLVVTNRETSRMKSFRIFINARDYGDNLDVSWHLTFKPTLLQAAMCLIPHVSILPRGLADIDLFDQQDLRAYSTVAHNSLLKSVDQLMNSLQQDPTKMNRVSRGFLGIS